MRTQFHWTLPSAYATQPRPGAAGLAGWIQVAQATEYVGFDGLFLGGGALYADPWTIAAALSQYTKRLQLLVTLRPELILPAVMANMAQSMQSITGGRLGLHMDIEFSANEQRCYGDFLNRDQHQRRVQEYLQILAALWRPEQDAPDLFRGQYYQLENARLAIQSAARPALYLQAQSADMLRLAAAHMDVDVQPATHPRAMQAHIEQVRSLAAPAYQRPEPLQFSCRVHVITRDSEQQAWDELEQLLQQTPPAPALPCGDPMQEDNIHHLHGTHPARARDLEIYPNLCHKLQLDGWRDMSVLVGSYAQVANRLEEFQALGIRRFVLSGSPALEDAFRIGEELLPRLRATAGITA